MIKKFLLYLIIFVSACQKPNDTIEVFYGYRLGDGMASFNNFTYTLISRGLSSLETINGTPQFVIEKNINNVKSYYAAITPFCFRDDTIVYKYAVVFTERKDRLVPIFQGIRSGTNIYDRCNCSSITNADIFRDVYNGISQKYGKEDDIFDLSDDNYKRKNYQWKRGDLIIQLFNGSRDVEFEGEKSILYHINLTYEFNSERKEKIKKNIQSKY